MTERYWHVLKSTDPDTPTEPAKSVPVELELIEIYVDGPYALHTARYKYPCGAHYAVSCRIELKAPADVKAKFLTPERFTSSGLCPICQESHPKGRVPLSDIIEALEDAE